ncbi:MAG: hypothetical protein KI793_27290 [Rivularia sp. (in: Bacteria)]|nr:hypothetical protein [Rivularia sp. MS3]
MHSVRWKRTWFISLRIDEYGVLGCLPVIATCSEVLQRRKKLGGRRFERYE